MDDIEQRVKNMEKDLEEYKEKRNQELDQFMLKTGIRNFIRQTELYVARTQGQIDLLKELLPPIPPESVPASTKKEVIQKK